MACKSFSKFVSYAICVCFMMLFFSACTTKETEEKNPVTQTTASDQNSITAPGTSSTQESYDPFGKYEPSITLTAVRSIDNNVQFTPGDPDRDSLEKNVWARAYEEQLGIKLEYLWTAPPDQYDNKWNLSVASDDIPDFGPVSRKTFRMLVEHGLIEDITDTFEKYASPAYKQFTIDDNGLALSYNTFNDRLLGMPITGSNPDNTPLLFVRKDWLDKVNMPAPKTIDDLINVANAFVNNKLGGENTYGLALAGNFEVNAGFCGMSGFLNGFGAYFDMWLEDSSGKLVYSNIQPEMKPALQKLQDMYKAGLIVEDFAVRDSGKTAECIAAGRIGMAYGVYFAPLTQILTNINSDEKAEWIVCPIPTIDGSPAKPQAAASVQNYIFIKKGTKYPEAPVKIANLSIVLRYEHFYEYSTAPDGFPLLKYSILGDLVQPWQNLNRHKEITQALKTGDDTNLGGDRRAVYGNILKALDGDRSQFGMNLVFGENSSFSVINEYKTDNRIVCDKYLSMTSTPTEEEKGSVLWDKLVTAMYEIIMGKPVEEFDSAVSEWRKMGGDDIVKEVNEWYESTK